MAWKIQPSLRGQKVIPKSPKHISQAGGLNLPSHPITDPGRNLGRVEPFPKRRSHAKNLACKYTVSVVLGLFLFLRRWVGRVAEVGEWGREKTAGAPAYKAQQLIPPAGRLDCGGLPQDGGAPRHRPSLDSAVAHIGAKAALVGASTPTQGDATPEAGCAASAQSGGVASHRCKAKGLGEAGQPCWERARGLR